MAGQMIDPAPWTRPFFEPGGGDALLLYLIYGKFRQPLDFSPEKYQCGEPPERLEIRLLHPSDMPNGRLPFLGEEPDFFGPLLTEQAPEIEASVHESPECLVFQLSQPDPADLEYLRDTLGLVSAAAASGGVAVLDVQGLRWFTSEGWTKEYFGEAGAAVHGHVSIFNSDDERNEGAYWMHTRGLRKFGRPDLSLRGLSRDQLPAALELFNRLVAIQCLGSILPDGQGIDAKGLPAGLTCHHEGTHEDPDFNNVHVEIRGLR